MSRDSSDAGAYVECCEPVWRKRRRRRRGEGVWKGGEGGEEGEEQQAGGERIDVRDRLGATMAEEAEMGFSERRARDVRMVDRTTHGHINHSWEGFRESTRADQRMRQQDSDPPNDHPHYCRSLQAHHRRSPRPCPNT